MSIERALFDRELADRIKQSERSMLIARVINSQAHTNSLVNGTTWEEEAEKLQKYYDSTTKQPINPQIHS